MSIYKRCTTKSRTTSAIKGKIEYVLDERKTKREYWHTLGVSSENAYLDMVLLKQIYCQLNGRQYLHWVLSHDCDVPIEVANNVAVEVLHLLAGKYQAICATHTNTDHLHTHYIINTINVQTGKKFSESISDMIKFREQINRILMEHGLNTVGEIEEVSEDALDDGNTVASNIEDIGDSNTTKKESFSVRLPVFSSNFEDMICPTTGTTYVRGVSYDTEPLSYRVCEGRAAFDKGNLLVPGIYYEQYPKESKFTLSCVQDRTRFCGKGIVESGRILPPGVLYADLPEESEERKE